MAGETHVAEPAKAQNKRRVGKKGGSKGKKRPRMLEGMPQNKPKKIDRKMKKLYQKRARDYNSDGDDNDEDEEEKKRDVGSGGESEKDEEEEEEEEGLDVNGDGGNSDEGEESGRIQPGITMFVDGSRAFKIAFRSIIKKSVPEDALGPVLSAHKKLIAEKLAEEEAERKVKGEAKKEKQLLAEKGHVKPANYLDSNENFLIGVATKGVVKLFNAVNKAQHAQKGLDPLRYKDAKVLISAFFHALPQLTSAKNCNFMCFIQKKQILHCCHMGNLESAILYQRIKLWTHEIQDRGIGLRRSAQMRSGDGHCWWSDVIVGHRWRSGAINGGGRQRWSGAVTSGGHWWMRGAVGGDDSI